jgi:hypothetical protein
MRLRLLAVALAAAAAVPMAPPAQAALRYTRECGGKMVDSQCYHDYCGIIDCVRYDCQLWSDALGGGNAAVCVGFARPRDPVE